ncbi:MAG: hypothetical protein KAK01_04590 [Candidatus Marinimicrobia bacterium]|nr:hypothetical protein [Candidatus Neomarinimicrobiota bacterium]
MHKLKKISLFILMLSLAVTIQLTFPACEENDDNGDNGDNGDLHQVGVLDPTNDYEVIVQIMGIGSMGCSMGDVILNGSAVEDADFKINSVEFVYDEDLEVYTDQSNLIAYTAGTEYNLIIKHSENTIATGYAIMPSIPTVNNITSPYSHNLNTDLELEWVDVTNASSILVTVQFEDTVTWEDEIYHSGLISGEATSFTIPGSFFDSNGEYVLTIEAYYGIKEGLDMDAIDSTKGYNIDGPAGIFMAVTVFPSDLDSEGFIIQIGTLAQRLGKQTENKISYRELVARNRERFLESFKKK